MSESTLNPRFMLQRPPLPRGKANEAGHGSDQDPARVRLRREAEIDGNLEFVNKLLNDYDIKRKENAPIYEKLEKIREHENEQRLFLGVVGEFSSGKSTLINALLRDDLLRTDVLQGTTAAATLISYGPKLAVEVRPLPGNVVVRSARTVWRVLSFPVRLFQSTPQDRESMRELIHQTTADEKISSKVLQVEVQHSAAALERGMVIVDLPGTNAENPRHGQVTAAALRELCDAAIIVIPADVPLSESLWNFLQGHIENDVLRRCVFIVNKADLIRRPKDRERLVDNLKIRLTRELSLPNPCMVLAAPVRLMETLPGAEAADLDDAQTPEEREKWVREFANAEAQLWRVLHESKLLLQVERLVRLLGQVFGHLEKSLKEHQADYRQRHEALLANQIPDLREFIEQARDKYVQAYLSKRGPIIDKGVKKLVAAWKASVAGLSSTIFGTKSKKELQDAVKDSIPSGIKAAERTLRDRLREVTANLEKAAEAEHRAFFAKFQELYRRLASLGGHIRHGKGSLATNAASAFGSNMSSTNKELAISMDATANADLAKKAGGAAAGAVIGTLVFPGVGTVIGGVLGGVLGALFGPSLSDLQTETWNRLAPALDASFEQFAKSADDCIERVANDLARHVADTIRDYGSQYAKLVKQMEQRDRDEAAHLAELSKKVARDLQQIQARQQRLGIIRERLRNQ